MGLSCAPPFACHFIAQQVLVFALANVTTVLDFRVRSLILSARKKCFHCLLYFWIMWAFLDVRGYQFCWLMEFSRDFIFY